MRIIHLSDTHLGFSDYNRIEPGSGINARELDVYNAFNQVIEHVLKTKPDVIVHAGDLFDSVRPSNRAILELFRQLSKLASANIPVILVAGNHSTPRHPATGSIFRLIEFFPNVYTACDGKLKVVEIGDAKFHLLPHAYDETMLSQNLHQLAPDKGFRFNVLVTHAGIREIAGHYGAEFKDQTIPLSVLKRGFDYVALGHYHKFMKVTEQAYYSGSPERLSFNEANDPKGFIELNLGNGDPEFIPTNSRAMLHIAINCLNLSATKIMREVNSQLGSGLTGKIVRMTFQDVAADVYAGLDTSAIKRVAADAFHFEYEFTVTQRAGSNVVGGSAIGPIFDEFNRFLRKQQIDSKFKRQLEETGLSYLREALVEEEEES